MKPLLPLVLSLPIVSGMISTALFFSQGGFGGGHGRFDLYIFLLALPSGLGQFGLFEDEGESGGGEEDSPEGVED